MQGTHHYVIPWVLSSLFALPSSDKGFQRPPLKKKINVPRFLVVFSKGIGESVYSIFMDAGFPFILF